MTAPRPTREPEQVKYPDFNRRNYRAANLSKRALRAVKAAKKSSDTIVAFCPVRKPTLAHRDVVQWHPVMLGNPEIQKGQYTFSKCCDGCPKSQVEIAEEIVRANEARREVAYDRVAALSRRQQVEHDAAEWREALANYREEELLYLQGPSQNWKGRDAADILAITEYLRGVLLELPALNLAGVIFKLEMLWEHHSSKTVSGGAFLVELKRDLNSLIPSVEAEMAQTD